MVQVNEKLVSELETVKQQLALSQTQVEELMSEKVINTKKITDLEAERSRLIREKEELQTQMYEDDALLLSSLLCFNILSSELWYSFVQGITKNHTETSGG